MSIYFATINKQRTTGRIYVNPMEQKAVERFTYVRHIPQENPLRNIRADIYLGYVYGVGLDNNRPFEYVVLLLLGVYEIRSFLSP